MDNEFHFHPPPLPPSDLPSRSALTHLPGLERTPAALPAAHAQRPTVERPGRPNSRKRSKLWGSGAVTSHTKKVTHGRTQCLGGLNLRRRVHSNVLECSRSMLPRKMLTGMSRNAKEECRVPAPGLTQRIGQQCKLPMTYPVCLSMAKP